jgi:hypothetical protein
MVVPVRGSRDGSADVRRWESRHPEEVKRARENPGIPVVCEPWYSRTRRFLRFLGFRLKPSRGRWEIYFERGYLHAFPI